MSFMIGVISKLLTAWAVSRAVREGWRLHRIQYTIAKLMRVVFSERFEPDPWQWVPKVED